MSLAAEIDERVNPQTVELICGTKLGPYEIQSSLGAGGMGEVYRAREADHLTWDE